MTIPRPVALAVLLIGLTLASACSEAEKTLDPSGVMLGKDLTSLLGEATRALGGVTDPESARVARTELDDLDRQLGELVSKAGSLTPDARRKAVALARTARPSLETALARVGHIAGVGEVVQPVVDSLLDRIDRLE